MSDVGRLAVLIGLSGRDAEALRGALPKVGFVPSGEAPDGVQGLRLVRRLQPGLAVAGAIMPGADGVAFAHALRALKLSTHPAILLLKPSGLRLPGEDGLPGLGALAMESPFTEDRLFEALERLEALMPPLSPAGAARLAALLDDLGVPEHPGRECLRHAVALVWADRGRLSPLKSRLYPAVARRAGMSPAQVERAIRHAIDVAWRSGALEQQHRLFGHTIDAKRGKPTCGEMIAQLAEELRWEE